MDEKCTFWWLGFGLSINLFILFLMPFVFPNDTEVINEVSIASKIVEGVTSDLENDTKINLEFSDGTSFESYASELEPSELFILNLNVGDTVCYKHKSRYYRDIELINFYQD